MIAMDSRLLDRIQIAFPDATFGQVIIALDAVEKADYAKFSTRAEAIQKRYLCLAVIAKAPTFGPFAGIKEVNRLLAMLEGQGARA